MIVAIPYPEFERAGELAWFTKADQCPCCRTKEGDCSRCEHYRCAVCDRWVPWEFGADDGMPLACDDCWAERQREAA